MVKFKNIKFKHYRQAQALDARVNNGEASDEDVILFAVSLVAEWDFVDIDTEEEIPVGEVDELSTEQIGELILAFNSAFEGDVTIPKPNAGA
jgi:hypothetical protein